MWTEIKRAYRDAAGIVVAAPLLFALPVAAEFIQHVIEIRIGMFESVEAMQRVGDHPARMGFGQVKILSLILLVYWASRSLAARDGAPLRVVGDGRSALLFVLPVAWSFATALVQQFGGAVVGPYMPSDRALILLGFVYFALLFVLDTYLIPWKVGAAVGNRRLTFLASFRILRGNFWWSLGFFVSLFLPLMIAHYALNMLAVGRSETLLWAILAVDSLEVGWLGLVLAVSYYIIARRATERSGAALV